LAISREKKEALVQQYTEALKNSDGVIIAEYRGLRVSDLQTLRNQIREAEGSFAVVKNTLARRALAEAGLPVPEELLVGPLGIGFGYNNIAGVAKVMTTFAKGNELLAIKGGLIGNSVIDSAGVKALTDLPSIEVLRAQLLGVLNAPATQLVGVVNAPANQLVNVVAGGVRQVVNVLKAYSDKGAAEGAA
jgi:large subunit ribosomal protein L10